MQAAVELRICASTCRACACFALTEGSPVAVPAAIHAAATTRTSAGACRFRTLITDSRESLAASAPEGPVRHKFGRLAGVSDSLQPTKAHKAAAFADRSCSNLAWQGPHKVAEIPAVSCYVSRDRERAEDTVCGALAGLVAASCSCRLGGSGRRARRTRVLQSQVSTLDARTHTRLLDLYALDIRPAALHRRRSRRSRHKRPDCAAQQHLLVQQLSATRKTLCRSQVRLADNLRTLYKQGDEDPLAVVLGAQSLDDAVTQLDDSDARRESEQASRRCHDAAQLRLRRAPFDPRRAPRRNRTLPCSLRSGRRRDLGSARAERLAFISRLRSDATLKSRQISALQQTALPRGGEVAKLQASADAAATALQPPDPSAAPALSPTAATVSPRNRRRPRAAGRSHRQLDRLLAPRPHGHRHPGRLGRRCGRSRRLIPLGTPADDPRLRRRPSQQTRELRPRSRRSISGSRRSPRPAPGAAGP